ncbi:MAG: chloride channel protein [Candidatus Methylomirabilota bacterium]|nr:MAG: chloride channel protein [candidate division NC10 bacterium]
MTLLFGRDRIRSQIRRLLRRLAPPQALRAVVIAIAVGIATGLGAVGFIRLLQLSTFVFFDGGRRLFAGLGRYYVLLLPAIGGLIVGPLIVRFAREAKGHGVPEVMTAMVLRGGRIRRRVALVKILASAITIGSGGSAGREGPMIQIGSSIGSSVAQWLRMPTEQVRTLVACGAAGGVAATFNAPIAGAMFALEILLGRFTADFSLVVLSAFAAAVVSRATLGNFPAFAVPPWDLISEKELLFYALLGLLSGLAALAFVKILYAFEDLFARSHLPEFLQPAIGGLVVGGIGLFLPQVFGTGLPTMGQILVMRLPLGALLALQPAKVMATSFTLGSGGSGGVFAPSLLIGGLVGGAFGAVIHSLFPAFTASYGAYALVGMSATFGAAAQAPITSILILFEMTDDYRIILPLMSTTIVAVLLFRACSADSIYTLKLTRQGIRYGAASEGDLMAEIQVGEALTHHPLSLAQGTTIHELLRLVATTGHEWFPIVDGQEELVGVVTYRDVAKAVDENRMEDRVVDYATHEVLCAFPDESLREVLIKFHERDLGHLPVVERTSPRRLVGIISRRHVIKAYNRALVRRRTSAPSSDGKSS